MKHCFRRTLYYNRIHSLHSLKSPQKTIIIFFFFLTSKETKAQAELCMELGSELWQWSLQGVCF